MTIQRFHMRTQPQALIAQEVQVLARDVMVSPVITAGLDATVREVAKTLRDKRISAVPVLDGKEIGRAHV